MQTYLHFALFFCLLINSFKADPETAPPEFNQNVQKLSESSYYDLAYQLTPESNQIVFAMFFAPWCGHCKHFKSIWNELADSFKESLNFNVVSIDVEENKKLLGQFEIKAVPTLKIFYQGKSYTYESTQRDVASLKEFAQLKFLETKGTELPQRPSFIERIQEKSSEYLNKALLFLFQNPIVILGGFICLILSIIALYLSKKTSENQLLIDKIENAIETDEDQDESEKEEKEEKQSKQDKAKKKKNQ